MPAHNHDRNGGHHDSGTSGESQTDSGGSEAHNTSEGPMSDEQLAAILSKRRIRFEDFESNSIWAHARAHAQAHEEANVIAWGYGQVCQAMD